MRYLIFVLCFCSVAIAEDFESLTPGSFRRIVLEKVTIEAEPDDVAYVTSEAGRHPDFGNVSIYTSGKLTLTFTPPTEGTTLNVAAYKKGNANWKCNLENMDGTPSTSYIADFMGISTDYPEWGPLWAFPWRHKVTKCVVTNSEGVFIDNLVIQ